MHLIISFCLCGVLALHGLKSKSLSISGALAATVVGLVTFSRELWLFWVVLLVFYLLGSRVTKVRLPLLLKRFKWEVQGRCQETTRGDVCGGWTAECDAGVV
jgi:uncharacterized membrane protein